MCLVLSSDQWTILISCLSIKIVLMLSKTKQKFFYDSFQDKQVFEV